jgi:FlaA1/EpsC-like NDP-sugar epimerase
MIREIAPKYGYMPKNIEIKIIGTKPGEKLYEELMSEEETRRSLELQNYFSVLPAFRGIYENIEYSYKKILSTNITNAYVSSNEESLTVNSIRKFLKKNHLLEIPNNLQKQRYWPGDK